MAVNNDRMPAVAGQFYPGSQANLRNELTRLFEDTLYKKDAIACVMPHAGYAYSGKVAASVAGKVEIKKNIIFLGPNHRGNGAAFSLMCSGKWRTPLGAVEINRKLAEAFIRNNPLFTEDAGAHRFEHSIEVEIPFFQYLNPGIKIVPITIKNNKLEELESAGITVGRAVMEQNLQKDTLIVASSDMTHYETRDSARKKDMLAIEDILKLDETKLFNDLSRYKISMCGFAAVAMAISAAKTLGAVNAELIKYQTSGDVTNDNLSVVGYAGIIISC